MLISLAGAQAGDRVVQAGAHTPSWCRLVIVQESPQMAMGPQILEMHSMNGHVGEIVHIPVCYLPQPIFPLVMLNVYLTLIFIKIC